MSHSPSTRQPLVDHAVLARLRSDLQPDPGACDSFIRNYIRLLPHRLDNLSRAAESMDADAAMDAVLSLKTSSMMVGASRLGVLAGDLEQRLRMSPTGPGPDPAPWTSMFLTHLDGIRDATAVTTARLASLTSRCTRSQG